MTAEQYLRDLASAITQQEDLTDQQAKDILLELALRIYALLQAELPTTRFERYLAWPTLRRKAIPLVLEASDRIALIVFNGLIAAETQVITPVSGYFNLPAGGITPRPVTQVLDETEVVGTRMSSMFVRSAQTGLSPFVSQLLQLLERTVLSSFMQEVNNAQLAQKIVGTRTRAGIETPVITKGTVANAWRERLKSIVAAAYWQTVASGHERATAAADAPVPLTQEPPRRPIAWRWIAILDPVTCPVCRPLHNTRAPTPRSFPKGPPPLHPQCRCITLPIFG
jgi:hypothetical protein